MTETNIQQSLRNIAALIPSEVDKISEDIAETIYNTAHTRTVYESTERLNTLMLLQNTCLNRTNHLRINATNYNCFLKAIAELSSTGNEDNYEKLPLLDVTKSITEYYERLAQLHIQRQMCLNIITEHDCKKCEVSDVTYKTPCNTYDCLNDLKLIRDQRVKDSDISHREVPATSKSNVNLAYALLNFNDKTASTLLCSILQQWSLEEPLEEEKTKFVNYLWKNLDLVNHDVFTVLLENFKFVLEKIIIKTCTGFLQSDDRILTPNVKRTFAACSNNDKLRCSVMNLLYALYACSGFNETLLGLIEMVRVSVLCENDV